jgi:hypothetical protein
MLQHRLVNVERFNRCDAFGAEPPGHFDTSPHINPVMTGSAYSSHNTIHLEDRVLAEPQQRSPLPVEADLEQSSFQYTSRLRFMKDE